MQILSAPGMMFANNAQAFLWSLTAAALVVAWISRRSLDHTVALGAFWLFAAAQWLDACTSLHGLWTLTAIKSACIAAFAILLWRHERARRATTTQEA